MGAASFNINILIDTSGLFEMGQRKLAGWLPPAFCLLCRQALGSCTWQQ